MKILKETKERINKNLLLFGTMILLLILIFNLIHKFYGILIIDGIPWIIRNKYSIPGDVIGDDKMFITSSIYGILGIIVIFLLFINKFIKGNKKKTNKWYYKMTALTVVGVYGLFYITNPWYTLQTHPRLFMYQDGKNITNKEIYFFLTERYGFKSDLYKPFRTLDESIEGLEFAMHNNETGLYDSIFYDLEKFGYTNVLENYNDKTFQAFLLDKISYINTTDIEDIQFLNRNITYLDYLEKNGLDNMIIKIAKNIKKEYDKYKQGVVTEKEFFNNINNYRIIDFHDKLNDIKGIHQGMFRNDNKLYKYKKDENGDWELIKNN